MEFLEREHEYKYTFGLTRAEYFRHLFFSCLVLLLVVLASSSAHFDFVVIILLVICTVLYPFSRFIYEQVVGFLWGENLLIFNLILFIPAKIFTMLLCWFLAIFISPIYFFFFFVFKLKNKID